MQSAGPFPTLALPDLEGATHPLAEAWSGGEALVLVGHRTCKTTRQTLPYVDRIHRRRGARATVMAVLQDDAETARTLAVEQALDLPLRLEADPYLLAAALGLEVVPTLFLIDAAGQIVKALEGFNRAELEVLASRLGVTGPLFTPEDKAPAFRPG